MKIWHVLFLSGLVLLFGTIGAADMGAINSVQIILQVVLGIGLMVLSYITFITACNRWYKKK